MTNEVSTLQWELRCDDETKEVSLKARDGHVRMEIAVRRHLAGKEASYTRRQTVAADLQVFLNGGPEPTWVTELRRNKNMLTLGDELYLIISSDISVRIWGSDLMHEAHDQAEKHVTTLARELALPGRFELARKAYRASSLYRGG